MSEPDPYTRETPLTDEQLAEERKSIVKEYLEDYGKEIESFTCDGCARAKICRLAFDYYNTNGDISHMFGPTHRKLKIDNFSGVLKVGVIPVYADIPKEMMQYSIDNHLDINGEDVYVPTYRSLNLFEYCDKSVELLNNHGISYTVTEVCL